MSVGANYFDESARSYDRDCRRLVPDIDGFYGAVVEDLSFSRDEGLRVLDLGAGTGLLSAVVAERFPAAKITLVDLSAEMLRMARRRFANENDRFEFRIMDYAHEPLPGESEGFDLVVSALSIHHLEPGDKRQTFEKVHGSLAGGGRFVNADQVKVETPEAMRGRHEDRTHRPPGAGFAEKDPKAAHPHAIEEVALEVQMAWLREAGFEKVGFYYRNNCYAVYGGHKGERKGKDATDE